MLSNFLGLSNFIVDGSRPLQNGCMKGDLLRENKSGLRRPSRLYMLHPTITQQLYFLKLQKLQIRRPDARITTLVLPLGPEAAPRNALNVAAGSWYLDRAGNTIRMSGNNRGEKEFA